MLGTDSSHNNGHLRGDLVEDPALSSLDSRSDTSGMTIANTCLMQIHSPRLSTNTKSGMDESVHVSSSWMMNKAMSGMTVQDVPCAYCPDVPSALLHRRYCIECRIKLN